MADESTRRDHVEDLMLEVQLLQQEVLQLQKDFALVQRSRARALTEVEELRKQLLKMTFVAEAFYENRNAQNAYQNLWAIKQYEREVLGIK